jgi:ribonuclease P protein component
MSKFSRSYRLVSKEDFNFVFTQPLKVTRKNLVALYRPNQQEHARLGVIISKRYAKRAVGRNQIRRFVRESFRKLQEPLKGFDVIILMRSEWRSLDTKIWRDEIDNLWQLLINSLPPP